MKVFVFVNGNITVRVHTDRDRRTHRPTVSTKV